MKKLLVICLMLAIMSVSALTASANFVSSPSNNPAPDLEDFKNESEDCPADIVITGFSDRNQLPEELREQMEKAYDEIAGNSDDTNFEDIISDIANEKDVPKDDIAVSDLFNINDEGCDDHDEHGKFDIKLDADTLDKFVGLVVYDGEEWKIIEDAKVNDDGHLEFSTDIFGTAAILVEANEDVDPPLTGEDISLAVCAAVMVASAVAFVVIWTKSRKPAAK